MQSLLTYLESAKFWVSVIILAAAMLFSALHKKIIDKFQHHTLVADVLKNKSHKLHFLYVALQYLFWFLVITSVLQINGINIGSLITGLGVIGIIVGFALQDVLKDIMMGIDIITDKFYSVGDVIRYKTVDGKPITAKVTGFNMKVTKLYDFNTGSRFTICNRNITEAEVVPNWMDLRIPASYDVSKSRMDELCRTLCEKIKKMPDVTSCKYLGVAEFADSTIYYLLRAYCPPEKQAQKRRDVNGLIMNLYEKEGLSIPYPQLDAHLYPERPAFSAQPEQEHSIL